MPRVLVVDDSSTIRKVVGSVLTRAGYEVGNAADGAQALLALRREKWGLALVDFVMPKINGFELCKKMREDPELRNLPVILMSAKADKIREHFLRQTGALDAITKPFDPRALLLTIEGALKRIEQGTYHRPNESVPPTSESTDTLLDPFSVPISGRAAGVPDGFLRKLSQFYARLAPQLKSERDEQAIYPAMRAVFGEEGLMGLYGDLVGPTAKAALSGDLTAIPLAEVLQLLQLQRQSGLLTVFNGVMEMQIWMRDGLIDLASSRGAADEFRLGRYVVEGGKLTRAALDEFIAGERAQGKGRLLGEALIAEGIMTNDEIERSLGRQTSELIYDVLRWTRGRFLFDPRAPRNASQTLQLGLPVAAIVMEGFRRVDEWRLMEGVLGDFEQVFYRDTGAIEAMGTGGLSREERIVLGAVDGERTVRDLIGALHMGSFDVCKILYQLVQSRLIRRRAG